MCADQSCIDGIMAVKDDIGLHGFSHTKLLLEPTSKDTSRYLAIWILIQLITHVCTGVHSCINIMIMLAGHAATHVQLYIVIII